MVFVFGGDDVVAAIVVVKVVVFGNAAVVKTIVLAGDVDVRAFAGDAVAVVVEDDVEWNSCLLGEDGAAVVLWTAIRFVFLFLQKKINKSSIK